MIREDLLRGNMSDNKEEALGRFGRREFCRRGSNRYKGFEAGMSLPSSRDGKKTSEVGVTIDK